MASPITSVKPCSVDGTSAGSAVTNLPVPSKYVFHLHDISDSEAGRLESLTMLKNA